MDFASRIREFGGICQNVADALNESGPVATDVQLPVTRDGQRLVPLLAQQGFNSFYGLRENSSEFERLPIQLYAPPGDARDIQQIVDQTRELRDLPSDNLDAGARLKGAGRRPRKQLA